jgi:hypothetical protein
MILHLCKRRTLYSPRAQLLRRNQSSKVEGHSSELATGVTHMRHVLIKRVALLYMCLIFVTWPKTHELLLNRRGDYYVLSSASL